MTKVKICGLKEVEHVAAAVSANADFIGFVFAPSKRQISIVQAAQLAANIPSNIKKVGVFVNAEKSFILEAYKQVGLDYIQYHGDESPSFIEEVGLPAIKAFSVNEEFHEEKLIQYDVDYYLLDAPGEKFRGGSGKPFNWELIDSLFIPKDKIILAGGLNSNNVQQAIHCTLPYAVDVSSGVEQNGIKNCLLITQFVKTAKEVLIHD